MEAEKISPNIFLIVFEHNRQYGSNFLCNMYKHVFNSFLKHFLEKNMF